VSFSVAIASGIFLLLAALVTLFGVMRRLRVDSFVVRETEMRALREELDQAREEFRALHAQFIRVTYDLNTALWEIEMLKRGSRE
jgi:hypothetical protein